jgi:thioredoxin reductase
MQERPPGMTDSYDAIVIGGGPAGLACSRELSRRGVGHRVLERGDAVGYTWAHLYDGLVLHTGKHLSSLPGLPFPSSTPLFPSRADFMAYLHHYADLFQVPVETGEDVASVRRDTESWMVQTTSGTERRAKSLIVATGILTNPHVPAIPGRSRFGGSVLHSVEYRRPDPFAGQRVLVVGAGNSSGEICAELADAGVDVTVSIRSGARTIPRQLLGIPVQYLGVALNVLPRSIVRRALAMTSGLSQRVRGSSPLPPAPDSACANVPLIGFHLADGVRNGRIHLRTGVAAFTGAGVRFTDGTEERFDRVILATGYRAALDMLGQLTATDACGFAERRNRVVSTAWPSLYFVGHNYDASGGLRNIARDARLAASLIARR